MTIDRKEYTDKVDKLTRAATAYYVYDKPILTDNEYDKLYHEVLAIEKYLKPSDVDKRSPTQKVGGVVLDKFRKEKHLSKMYSMEDIFEYKELEKWLSKYTQDETFHVTAKLDGASLNVLYNNKMVHAVTRGDGTVGEVVTHNTNSMPTIPKYVNFDKKIEIRGEVYITKDHFNKLNKERGEKSESLFANPRNTASGSLRQLDSNIAKSRNLQFIPWGIGYGREYFNKASDEYKFFAQQSFKNNPFVKLVTRDDVIGVVKELSKSKNTYEVMIDGCVIRLNDNKKAELLGYSSKYPKFMVAFKYPAVEKVTRVTDVIFQVGRTGIHTPVAVLDPIEIDGSVVSKATLHNKNYINTLDLKLGDQVTIIKSGDIIPKIINVFSERRDGLEKPVPIPITCVECSNTLSEIGPNIVCVNDDCPGKLISKLSHACGRDVLNIDGLSEKTLMVLIENNLVKELGDIFKLHYEELIIINGFQDKKVRNILDSIENSKECTLDRFINCLNIPNIGRTASKLITKHFGNSFMDITKEELLHLDGIGDTLADSYTTYMTSNKGSVMELYTLIKPIIENNTSDKYLGKTVCITGSFTKPRHVIVDIIEKLGGGIVSGVSSKLDYLLVGDKPGGKLKKAQELNIEILKEKDLL